MNSGIARSAKVLRRILGLPDNPATVTDEVLRAAAARDPRTVIAAISDERLAFLMGLRTWPVFGSGWARRVAEVRATALRMAGPAAKTGGATARTAAGAIVVAGGAAAQQAHHGGMRLAIVAVIAGVTALLALGVWLIWRWRRRRQQST